jgi:SAM-dependent methyltransferase
VTLDALISPAYQQEQIILHRRPNGYGGKGKKWATAVQAIAWTHDCASVLDYGCGEGSLVTYLQAVNRTDEFGCKDFPPRCPDFREYDPAIEGKDTLPEPADLVVCTDVLEHIEPEKLDAVLSHLKSLTKKVLFVVIATRPSGKTLTDGRNAHLILESSEWWHARMEAAGFIVQDHPPTSPLLKPSREWVAVLRWA